ncbi:hypothetical protein ACVWWR_003439 [Bradyrhizobium sp. LM3.2]
MTLATRLAIAMILLVAVAVSAAGWLSHYSLEQAFLPRVLDRIETQSRLLASQLEVQTDGARADIVTFRSRAAVRGMIDAHFNNGIDPTDHLSEKNWRERLLPQLVAVVGANPTYAKFRVINIDGSEYLRIDRSGPTGSVRIVPDDGLQNKDERFFFQEAIKLSEDQVYVSPVDLNVDDGVIQMPYVPTLRVAAPLFGSGHRLFGIVVVNVDMRQVFDRIRITSRRGEQVYVVGRNGDYLVHPDRTREFGSQLGTPTRWQNDFPYFSSVTGSTLGATQVVRENDGKPSGNRDRARDPGRGSVGRHHPHRALRRLHGAGRHHREDDDHDRPHRSDGRRRAGRAAGAVADPADRPAHHRGRCDRARQARRYSNRRIRRDRPAGACLRPHGRRNEREDIGIGARGSGASAHGGRPRPARRSRTPVQRGGRILGRFDRHADARRHHHRVERGGRAPLRPYWPRRRSDSRLRSSCRPIAAKRARIICGGFRAANASNTSKRCACARTALRSISR